MFHLRKLSFYFLLFHLISLSIFTAELELQSKEKKSGDILSSSEWNSLIGKIKSSNKSIKEEMIIGNWSCSAFEMSTLFFSGVAGWTTESNGPFNIVRRENYPLTFSSGSPGSWSSSEDYFFLNTGHPTNGFFRIINNTLYISYSGSVRSSFNLIFHGKSRFSAKMSYEHEASQHLRNFYCDKQN